MLAQGPGRAQTASGCAPHVGQLTSWTCTFYLTATCPIRILFPVPKITPIELSLASKWKEAKGRAAEFVKLNKLNFNGGLSPEIQKMVNKWGTPAGATAAKKVTTIATGYRIKIDGAKNVPGFKPILQDVLKTILTSAAKKQDL